MESFSVTDCSQLNKLNDPQNSLRVGRSLGHDFPDELGGLVGEFGRGLRGRVAGARARRRTATRRAIDQLMPQPRIVGPRL